MNTLTKRLLWIAVCCLPFISGCKQPNENAVSKNAISDALYRNLPFEMPEVQQPAFPAYEVNISKFGAKGDGMTLNTKAINDAIKEVNQSYQDGKDHHLPSETVPCIHLAYSLHYKHWITIRQHKYVWKRLNPMIPDRRNIYPH